VKLSVIDACFSINKQSQGLAAMWIEWFAQRAQTKVVPVRDSDVCAVTCVDPRNWEVCRTIKKKWPHVKPKRVRGQSPSATRHDFHADAVCDGRRFMAELIKGGVDAVKHLPETWIRGQDRPVEVAVGFPWDCPPIQAEDGAYRVWCGRGCKKRCAFCQTGWAMAYEENPNGYQLIRQAKNLIQAGKRIAYLSNDPMQHTFGKQLPPVQHGSYSLDYMKRYGAPKARQIRLGVEGVSERLRKFVYKPISTDDLVKASAWLCSLGKSVRWFMIAGLPTEEDGDWEELKDAVTKWKKICHKGVLAISFTAWQPEPATPLGVMPLDDAYWPRWESFKKWFFDGDGWSNRVKLMAPAQPKARLKSAIARMGLDEKTLRAGGQWGPNDRVMYAHKTQRNTIAERMLGTNGR